MKQIVEFELPDNKTILVEVEGAEESGLNAVSRYGEMVLKAQKPFEDALSNIEPMLKAIKKKFDEMEDSADEVEVKFGFKLTGQAGAVITVGGEASYEITMRWDNRKK